MFVLRLSVCPSARPSVRLSAYPLCQRVTGSGLLMLRALLEAEGTAAFAVYAVSQLGVAKQVGCVVVVVVLC